MNFLSDTIVPVMKMWFYPFENQEKKWEYIVNNYANIIFTSLGLFITGLLIFIIFGVMGYTAQSLLFFLLTGINLCASFWNVNITSIKYNDYKWAQAKRRMEQEQQEKRQKEAERKRKEEQERQQKQKEQKYYQREQSKDSNKRTSIPTYNNVGDYLKVLGLPSYITDSMTIKKAYRKLMLQYHPDKEGGNEEKAKELNNAYENIKNILKIN